jgi:hypothetical protein
MFLQFAVEKGAIDERTRRQYAVHAEAAFRALALAQGVDQQEADPARRFRDLLRAAVAAGRAHIRSLRDNGKPEMRYRPEQLGWRDGLPGGECIGWIGPEGLFLIFDVSLAVAQRLGTEARDPLPAVGITLKRCLLDANMIASRDVKRQRLTVRLPGDPARREVLHVNDDFLTGAEEESETRPGEMAADVPVDDLEYLFRDLEPEAES